MGALVAVLITGAMLVSPAGQFITGLTRQRAIRQMRTTLYRSYRFIYGHLNLALPDGFATLAGPNFRVLHRPGDQAGAALVLAMSEDIYADVSGDIGYRHPSPIPVVVHPDRDGMRQAFGWLKEDSASGAYWAGVIHVLSPDTWLPWVPEEQRARVYQRLSPMAHELAHFLLDYRVSGNYPRWFTEGLAQWVEYRHIGYRWQDPAGDLRGSVYPYAVLAGQFDRLPNQALAYRQALALVQHVIRVCHRTGLEDIIEGLEQGEDFADSLFSACGVWPAELIDLWLQAGRPS